MMRIPWKTKQSEEKYTLQFETNRKEEYELVEKAARMAVDGKTIADIIEVRHGEWVTNDDKVLQTEMESRIGAVRNFVKFLKEHACDYDIDNHHSFSAIDVEELDELLEDWRKATYEN